MSVGKLGGERKKGKESFASYFQWRILKIEEPDYYTIPLIDGYNSRGISRPNLYLYCDDIGGSGRLGRGGETLSV